MTRKKPPPGSPQHRSWNMSRIRGRDTSPEMAVRSFLHRRGLRYRLNDKGLPGKPDLVLKRWNAAVFVHGCFWHRHAGCSKAYTPKSNLEFWEGKFSANVERDRVVRDELERLGWNVLVIWECEVDSREALEALLATITR